MNYRNNYIKVQILYLATFLGLSLVISCDKTKPDTYEELRKHISTISVVNTHEHQIIPPEYIGQKYNFYTLLDYSYLKWDLISSGASQFNRDIINRGNLDTLWNIYGQYLDFCRNTTFYTHFLKGFQELYGYKDLYFTKEGIYSLSEKIAENYSNREEWFDKSVKTAGYDIMFIDQYWAPFSVDLKTNHSGLVFSINQLVWGASRHSIWTAEDAPVDRNPYKYAEKEGFKIKTLEDYLIFTDFLFKLFLEHQVVSIKNTLAYYRAIDFKYVPYEQAEALYTRSSTSLTEKEKKALEDFMFHRIIQKSIEVNLPIQIHTGYLAGNSNTLENSRPTKLNNLFRRYPEARFILFHAGYPWTGEFISLGKMFPNVYLDLVWVPQISREMAIRVLDDILDCVPYNKIFWGGDSHLIEESIGSFIFAKDVVAHVLTQRIKRGFMTEELAHDVARKIFRENAINVFNLQDKLE